jgi:hypothetical protein
VFLDQRGRLPRRAGDLCLSGGQKGPFLRGMSAESAARIAGDGFFGTRDGEEPVREGLFGHTYPVGSVPEARCRRVRYAEVLLRMEPALMTLKDNFFSLSSDAP